MRNNQLTFLIIIILLLLFIGTFITFYRRSVYGTIGETSGGDIIFFEVTIVDDRGNQYSYSPEYTAFKEFTTLWQGGIKVQYVLIRLYINPDYEGTANYLKINGGTIDFTVNTNRLQLVNFNATPIQINSPTPNTNNLVVEWNISAQDIENTAGQISDGTTVTFRVVITTPLQVELGLVDRAGNVIPYTRSGGVGTTATITFQYTAGVFNGFSVGFG